MLLQLSYQDLQMTTGILLNHLHIAAVTALVIWLCRDPTWNARKYRLFFCRNWVCAIPITNGTSSNATGKCLGENFPGGNLLREMSGSNVLGELSGLGNTPGKTSREKCWEPHAGLQLVCTCSGYDLCHPGYIAYRQTHSQIDSQTYGRAVFDRLYY